MKMQLTIYLTSLSVFFILLINSYSAKAQHWNTNFEEARRLARQKKKNILMVFYRKDWPLPCVEIEKNILNSKAFISYSNQYLTLLKVEFPSCETNVLMMLENLQNKKILEQYNKENEYPYLVVVNDKGSILGSMGYSGKKPENYINKIKAIIE